MRTRFVASRRDGAHLPGQDASAPSPTPFSLPSAEQYKLLSDHIEQMATE